jgi:hypothetical protein
LTTLPLHVRFLSTRFLPTSPRRFFSKMASIPTSMIIASICAVLFCIMVRGAMSESENGLYTFVPSWPTSSTTSLPSSPIIGPKKIKNPQNLPRPPNVKSYGDSRPTLKANPSHFAVLGLLTSSFVGLTLLRRTLHRHTQPERFVIMAAASGVPEATPAAGPVPSDALLQACKAQDKPKMEAEMLRLATEGSPPYTTRKDLCRTWQLTCTETDGALVALGSGRPLDAGLSVMDAFLVIQKDTVEWRQVVRRFGPWPNELYVFKGDWKFRPPDDLRLNWTRFEIANANRGKDGLRKFAVQVAYVDAKALLLRLPQGLLAFEATDTMEDQLTMLRVRQPGGAEPSQGNPLSNVLNLFRLR